MNVEKIFSYGTLQFEQLQIANFGRKLKSHKDRLSKFKQTDIEIKDTDVVATSGIHTPSALLDEVV